MTVSKRLRRAECQDCSPRWNSDWGYWEPVHKEAVNPKVVHAWCYVHVYSEQAKANGTHGHRMKIFEVTRISVDVAHVNPALLKKLGLKVGKP